VQETSVSARGLHKSRVICTPPRRGGSSAGPLLLQRSSCEQSVRECLTRTAIGIVSPKPTAPRGTASEGGFANARTNRRRWQAEPTGNYFLDNFLHANHQLMFGWLSEREMTVAENYGPLNEAAQIYNSPAGAADFTTAYQIKIYNSPSIAKDFLCAGAISNDRPYRATDPVRLHNLMVMDDNHISGSGGTLDIQAGETLTAYLDPVAYGLTTIRENELHLIGAQGQHEWLVFGALVDGLQFA
jgi:hypothetical protein